MREILFNARLLVHAENDPFLYNALDADIFLHSPMFDGSLDSFLDALYEDVDLKVSSEWLGLEQRFLPEGVHELIGFYSGVLIESSYFGFRINAMAEISCKKLEIHTYDSIRAQNLLAKYKNTKISKNPFDETINKLIVRKPKCQLKKS